MATSHQKHNRWLRMHPIHFHIGMYVALAALLITAMKSSEGIIAAVYTGAGNDGNGLLSETYMREAENHISHAQMVQHRRVNIGGA